MDTVITCRRRNLHPYTLRVFKSPRVAYITAPYVNGTARKTVSVHRHYLPRTYHNLVQNKRPISPPSVLMADKADAPTSSTETGSNPRELTGEGGGGPKAVIKNVDMSEEMQQESVDVASIALEKYNIEKDIAAQIKKEFDRRHGPTWHVVVGKNFGSYVTHETKHFIYFYIGSLAILIWKS